MKYFKMLSGKGRVKMSDEEVAAMFHDDEAVLEEQETQLDVLQKKVNELSEMINVLRKSELLSGLFALAERRGEQNGNS